MYLAKLTLMMQEIIQVEKRRAQIFPQIISQIHTSTP